jgi:hypothetical protein
VPVRPVRITSVQGLKYYLDEFQDSKVHYFAAQRSLAQQTWSKRTPERPFLRNVATLHSLASSWVAAVTTVCVTAVDSINTSNTNHLRGLP